MMRNASLTILTGPRQGEKIDLNRRAVLVGSSGQCQIRAVELGLSPDISGIIARIQGDRHGYTIEPGLPEVEVAVNGRPLTTTSSLADRDVIGLGGSPELISFEMANARKTPGDAPDQERHRILLVPEIAQKLAYVESLLKRLLFLDRETTTRVKATAVFIGLILLIGAIGFITNEIQMRSDVEQMVELARSQQQDIEEIRTQFNQFKQDMTVLKAGLEGELTMAERISVSYGPSVCLLEGSYGFVEPATGRVLRSAEANENGISITEGGERFKVSVDGTGPAVEETVIGTGFLVAKGYLLTNLHVAVPWWKNEVADQVESLGFQPRLNQLVAYFPVSPSPFRLQVVRSVEEYDLALCRFNQGAVSIPTPPLAADSAKLDVGQSIVLLGYPGAVEALLARLDDNVARRIISSTSLRVSEVARELAQQGLIRPLVTQGHVSALLSTRIVHDAATTTGGSGGPLFNRSGQVIGVNYAMFTEFTASNFAVPIRLAKQMLRDQAVITE